MNTVNPLTTPNFKTKMPRGAQVGASTNLLFKQNALGHFDWV